MKKMKKIIYSVFIIGLLFVLTNSCKKKDTNTTNESTPTLTTGSISNITQTTAACTAKIINDGGLTVTARGVCWSTNQTPTVADNKTINGTGIGSFQGDLTGLIPNTTYYVRPYATNSAGTNYGSVISVVPTGNTITDVDGNVYTFVTIGTQVWMDKNLKTTKYRNKDTIPNVTSNTDWPNASIGAYCNYNNDTNNASTYGRLYNWYAVTDTYGICPVGWHVPSDAEWNQLTNYLGGNDVAGGKMKETDTTHWASPNTGANNSSGFTGLPGGLRDYSSGLFYVIEQAGIWWPTSADNNSSRTMDRSISYSSSSVNSFNADKNYGYSVRCIRD